MKRVTPELQQWLVKQYRRKSLGRLRNETGLSLMGIRNILIRHGVKMRPRGAAERLRTKPAAVDRMVRMAQKGATIEEIAVATKKNAKTVWYWLKARGVMMGRSGSRSPLWKGGRYVTSEGYVRVRADLNDPVAVAMGGKTRSVLEHRLVMARVLGRPLEGWETVHHVDGNKLNNDPANLELRFGRHGKGVRLVCADCGGCHIRPAPLEG